MRRWGPGPQASRRGRAGLGWPHSPRLQQFQATPAVFNHFSLEAIYHVLGKAFIFESRCHSIGGVWNGSYQFDCPVQHQRIDKSPHVRPRFFAPWKCSIS